MDGNGTINLSSAQWDFNYDGQNFVADPNGGAYTSSSSATYVLPSDISMGQHTLTGYVVDSLGQASAAASWTGTVQAAQVVFNNGGDGQVQLAWAGDSGPVVVDAGQSYTIDGTASGLTVTLLTSNANYELSTNGSIDGISCASGVTAVNLSVDTGVNDTSYAMWVGDGHVGNVNLSSGSTVSIYARGDLWNLDGPSSDGTMTGVTAADLMFANLDGSIMGVDAIQYLYASGWLGMSSSQVVEAASGITNLTAYGVGATVIADARQDAGDAVMQVTVGDGGVPGTIDGGNVGNVQSGGDVNVLKGMALEGDFNQNAPGETLLAFGRAAPAANAPGQLPSITSDGDVTDEGMGNENLQKIDVKGALTFDRKGSVTVKGDIVAGSLLEPDSKLHSTITGDLKATNIRVTEGDVGTKKGADFDVQGNVVLSGQFEVAEGNILGMGVGKSMKATSVIVREGYIQSFSAAEDLTSKVQVLKGSVQSLTVGRDFLPPAGATQGDALVSVKGNLEYLEAGRNLGKVGKKAFGKIVAQSIGIVKVVDGSLTTNIESTSGDIGEVNADGMYGNVTAIDGNVETVSGQLVAGNITAKSIAGDNLTGNIGLVVGINVTSQNITADSTIGTVTARFANKPVTTKIKAQGGGQLLKLSDGLTLVPSALNLEVDSNNKMNNFAGSVTFTYGNVAPPARLVFAPNSALLNYTYNQINLPGADPTFTSNTSATVTQTAGNDAGVYLQNAKFDFSKAKPLQGNPVFTKINTVNTATTDFTLSVTQTSKNN